MHKPKKVICKHCNVEMEQVKPRYIITFRNNAMIISILSLISIILAIMNKEACYTVAIINAIFVFHFICKSLAHLVGCINAYRCPICNKFKQKIKFLDFLDEIF
jgi:hypothetical protein